MKHIKTFEGLFGFNKKKPKFNTGDYVVAINASYSDEIKNYIENNAGKILNISNDGFVTVQYNKILDGYLRFNNTNFRPINSDKMFLHDDASQIRHATTEEIEQYKLEEITKKYNL